jgi:hypothetical protein
MFQSFQYSRREIARNDMCQYIQFGLFNTKYAKTLLFAEC